MNTCSNCQRPYKPLRKGLCNNCYRYLRKHATNRPDWIDGRKQAARHGDSHEGWKGNLASPSSKRRRARRIYPLYVCDSCGKPATDRHHKDGDTGNNQPDNIARLCRHCHMVADGRMDTFLSYRNGQEKQPPKPCDNCGRPSKPLRKGLCHACNEYQRRHGIPRPYLHDGRTEKRLSGAI